VEGREGGREEGWRGGREGGREGGRKGGRGGRKEGVREGGRKGGRYRNAHNGVEGQLLLELVQVKVAPTARAPGVGGGGCFDFAVGQAMFKWDRRRRR